MNRDPHQCTRPVTLIPDTAVFRSCVRAFAGSMVRYHAAVNDKARALVKKIVVTPEANPTSQALTDAAATQHQKPASLSGDTFDTAYVKNEVAYYPTVNGALAHKLIPSADNAALKALLLTGLTIYRGHQAYDESLADTRARPWRQKKHGVGEEV